MPHGALYRGLDTQRQHASLRLPELHSAWPGTPCAHPFGHAVHASASVATPGPSPLLCLPAGHGAAATPLPSQ